MRDRDNAQPFSARPQDLPVKADLPRLRVEYGKEERLAYLGHLEVLSTVERSIRRAGLPFSIGNGFARRMRIQFSSALPVGASSACEYYDLRLTERLDAGEALGRLLAASPRALAPRRVAYVDSRLPALEAWLNRVDWSVGLEGGCPADELLEAIGEVARRGEVRYRRGEKEKVIDLGRTLAGYSVCEDEAGGMTVGIETRSGAGVSLRPQVLVDAAFAAMGRPVPDAPRVRKVRQAHEEDGRIVEPFCGSDAIASSSLF